MDLFCIPCKNSYNYYQVNIFIGLFEYSLSIPYHELLLQNSDQSENIKLQNNDKKPNKYINKTVN